MADLFDNPMGLEGFEFVEFAQPTPGVLEGVFAALGFTRVAQHRSKDVALYRQGEINFIVNNEPASVASYFAAEHGRRRAASRFACAIRTRRTIVRSPSARSRWTCRRPDGAQAARDQGHRRHADLLIDRYGDGTSIYDIDFKFAEGVDRHPMGHGLRLIDHLTHNVYRGRMAYWAGWYEKIFNFRELRYFDIKGEYTGLTSKAMTAPDGKIRIPLNEEASKSTGQIEEFLMQYNGEGIQHIALLTDDLKATIDSLRQAA
jgi:4-hydroxyphenylpyruvate dioxygenase